MRRATSRRLKGIGASPGIAQGTVYVVNAGLDAPPQFHLDQEAVPKELERFEAAVALSTRQIREIRDRLSGADGGEHLLILEAHLLMLNDAVFVEGVKSLVREETINAEWALRKTIERIRSMFEGLAHDYFRERGSDIDFVGERILRNLMGQAQVFAADDLPEDVVVVAHDLSPADTAQLTRFRVRGLITEAGSRTSHAAIVARSLDIPAVVGLPGMLQIAGTGDRIVIDGFTGEVILSPTAKQISTAKDSEQRARTKEKDAIRASLTPAHTKDGYKVSIFGNVELPLEADAVLSHGGEGVGLYRTEFLFVGRATTPTEEEHLQNYRDLARRLAGRPLTIRTLDLGGDKLFSTAHKVQERNPALGLRAIRLCLQQPELLRTQLRAILRVAAEFPVRLMLPMITDVSEIHSAKQLIRAEIQTLRAEGIEHSADVPVGIMVETPAAAIVSDLLAKEVDFFAIGTNDLIQYSLAIDRGNEHVAHMYRPLHPAILRLIAQTTEAASHAGISVCVCGEMAAEAIHTPVLLGLGITELSMNATAIPWVKKIVRDSSFTDCRRLVDELLMTCSPLEVEERLRAYLKVHHPELDG
ncbi:MAG: phosphoenolpyruvate--protein phosphotransferase [Deltaproteobacteria bacterium]|nr:phosphoenolpyruvate--protein phosphotransferase [Deltaproteobacteria bacterium]